MSYVLLDAERIEVALRDGRKVPARLVGLDLEVGLGVLKLSGPARGRPRRSATRPRSSRARRRSTVGMDDDGG